MDNNELKVLIFVVDGEYYATDIVEVERILGYEHDVKLPDSPDFVDGVINYESQILPVISIAKRFKVSGKTDTKDAKIIVTNQEHGKFGLIVDLVSEVKNISTSEIESTPDVVSGIAKRYIKGLIKLDKKIIIFLDFANILTDEEKTLL
jgi:purine-binding chemotaxis protein CheW